MKNKLTLVNVSKKINNKYIYKDISLSLEDGCYAISGRNGIGKTVLLELIAGVSNIDAGDIYLENIGSCNTIQYKQKLAYVPGVSVFYPLAKGVDILNFILSVKDNDDIKSSRLALNNFIKDSGLSEYMNVAFKNMSLGTQKKLFLSTMFIGDNSLIILDEPDNGLDAKTIDLLAGSINKFAENNIVITVSHDNNFLEKINPKIIRLEKTGSEEVVLNI